MIWVIDWVIHLKVTGSIISEAFMTLHPPPPHSCIPALSALSCWRASPCLHLLGKTTGLRRELWSWHGQTTEGQT